MAARDRDRDKERRSLLEFFEDLARLGEECAFVYPHGYRHERWSYRRVAEVASQFARELQARQIVKGDAVLLWSPNCAEWIAAFWGCALCGVIVVPIDEGASPEFARRIAEQVRTRLVLCSRERASLFDPIPSIDPATLMPAVQRHSAELFRPVEVSLADPLEIVFTSGTTAEPKGVVLSHANLLANIAPLEKEIRKYLKYERWVHPVRFLNLLPLSHVFGQFLGIFLPPLMGGTVVFENTLNPTDVMATIRRERVSVLVAVPRMIESLKQKIERDLEGAGQREQFARLYAASAGQHFLRRWWTFRRIRRQFGWKFWAMISGGAALDRETEEFWHRLGYAVIQGYGLTETTSLISLNHPFRTSRGSIGKVLPGREIKLAEDGEILVRGSGVASGYWNGRELQSVTGDEGWYGTGDLGALDAEGNLFFKGRKKEVIVTPAGMNVYPQDLEAALREQKEIRDCAVVGLDHGGNAEPCAVLILRDRHADARAIVARANETLAEFQRMRTWFVWPEEDFPRTSTGKPKRNVIRDAAASWAGESGPALSGSPVFSVADTSVRSTGVSPLAELVGRVTGRSVTSIAPGAGLDSDLGLSSLERVELLGALEDRYQIDLSETKFASATTVGDLERLLQGERGERREFHYPRWTLRWPVTWIRMAAQVLLVRPAVFLLGWPRVIGRENLRNVRGPLMVISNHVDDVDVGFIQTVLPERIRHRLATATGGEALEALRSPASGRSWAGRIFDRVQWTLGVALLNLFPLPRQAGFRKSFAYAGEAVDRGYSILVFPEGRHTDDGKLRPFRSGVGLLVNNLRIPVVPMRIDGLFAVKQAGKKFAAPGQIQVRIGKPVTFAAETDPEEIASALHGIVAGL
ncbi:MAG TPA: AMP-binding protein [Terriglobales bacterium]|nr:AMP-binding protein [Terriglobales bacterium]